MKDEPTYKRILLEVSGQMMAGDKAAVDVSKLASVASQIAELRNDGVQIAVVIGAGNIWRGAKKENVVTRRKADMVGMMATIVNALALQGVLEKSQVPARVLSAIGFEPVVEAEKLEPYTGGNAIKYLEAGEVVIFGGGTGNPYFTTDTAGALRALQIEADILMKATNVDGAYDLDPGENANTRKFETITLDKALTMQLGVMDLAAFSICRNNRMPIMIFALEPAGNIRKAVFGEKIGTLLTP